MAGLGMCSLRFPSKACARAHFPLGSEVFHREKRSEDMALLAGKKKE